MLGREGIPLNLCSWLGIWPMPSCHLSGQRREKVFHNGSVKSEEHSAETEQHVVPECDQTNKVSRSSLFISLQREAMNLRYCCRVVDYVTAQ